MKEDYVDFEAAKLLDKLGYPQKISKLFGNAYYNSKGEFNGTVIDQVENNSLKSVAAPTLYQAQKWFREVHNIDITPYPELGKYDVNISKNSEGFLFLEQFKTYEEVLLEGIKETCKYLLNEKHNTFSKRTKTTKNTNL